MSRYDNDNRNHQDDLERAVAEVLAEPLDERQVAAAAARVWKQLAAAGTPPGSANFAAGSPPASAAQGFPGCPAFGPQIAAFLRGELAPSRALLLEDHTRDCLPCRRALHAARQERAGRAAVALHEVVEEGPRHAPLASLPPLASPASVTPIAARLAAPVRRLTGGRPWLAAAALLLLGIGLGLAWFRALGPGAPGGVQMARVESVDGGLFRIAGASSVRVAAGAAVREGEQVRTAKASRAMLRLRDGSRIEMAERAGLSLAGGRDGNTIELERGLIVVQAAHQRPRHLYVATADCLVSVTGTIFAVNHGTKGSRVSVVEGEVHVQMNRQAQHPAAPASAAALPAETP
ncbi:MAG: FecR domain-containing protein, partial [Acidobacteria bacterium]|nr:FecR domain-containing protein [Acidobacteriota bacterium]